MFEVLIAHIWLSDLSDKSSNICRIVGLSDCCLANSPFFRQNTTIFRQNSLIFAHFQPFELLYFSLLMGKMIDFGRFWQVLAGKWEEMGLFWRKIVGNLSLCSAQKDELWRKKPIDLELNHAQPNETELKIFHIVEETTMGGYGSGRPTKHMSTADCHIITVSEAHTYNIALTYTEQKGSVPGRRPWMVAPCCSRRVGNLYLSGINPSRPACRTCLQLNYDSQHMHWNKRRKCLQRRYV